MDKLDTILKEVYTSGIHEERQQLDFMTNFYSTKQEAKQAIEAYIAERTEQAKIEGARDFVKWGYGDLCETKDTEDFPDMKDDPLANRCSSCEEWEHFTEWRDQLSNRSND